MELLSDFSILHYPTALLIIYKTDEEQKLEARQNTMLNLKVVVLF